MWEKVGKTLYLFGAGESDPSPSDKGAEEEEGEGEGEGEDATAGAGPVVEKAINIGASADLNMVHSPGERKVHSTKC